MSALPEINLCIVQPAGYVHSLGLLDQARYFRHQFRRLGASVSLAKNRLRHDAVNFVFGAHLGFDPALCQRQTCIFVNLEQLGEGGAKVSPEYLQLLATSAVVDYDADNLASYAQDAQDVPLVPFLYAPYLTPAEPVPLEERPIDLLFYGSMNARRRAWLDRIEALGFNIAMFDAPLYGPERDQYIAQAKVVLNVPFYETSRFEQARVSHCLSLGTPVISERTELSNPHPAFEDTVLFLQGDELEQFFSEDCGTPEFYDTMRAAVERFRSADPIEAYADLMGFARGYAGAHKERRDNTAWQPTHIRLGAGDGYQSGWLNIDVSAAAQPDLLCDLSRPLALPATLSSPLAGPIELREGSVERIHAGPLLAQAADLDTLMAQCLRLLQLGGEMDIVLPAGPGAMPAAGQRALDETSWLPYVDAFWSIGWFTHRFELTGLTWLDAEQRSCHKERANLLHLRLRKTETTLQERTAARTLQTDFGGVPDDLPAVYCEAPPLWARAHAASDPQLHAVSA